MTTQQTETPREIAERIILEYAPRYAGESQLVNAIESALKAERERAAGIAERAFEPAHTYVSENAHEYQIFDAGQRRAITKIAAAIRGEE